MKTEDVAYQDGAESMLGFLAYDETVTGKRPGILVVHEGSGLSAHALERTEMIAKLGYVAFAADMFGNRAQGSTPEAIGALMGPFHNNPEKLRARARAALTALARQPRVDATRLAAIGYCFGGQTVLELARGSTPDLRGVVSFHGNLETTSPAQPGKVTAKILLLNGAEDPYVPMEQVVKFEAEMRAAKADCQIVMYSGTGHGFTNPRPVSSHWPGVFYNEASDTRSWLAMQGFFQEIFAAKTAA